MSTHESNTGVSVERRTTSTQFKKVLSNEKNFKKPKNKREKDSSEKRSNRTLDENVVGSSGAVEGNVLSSRRADEEISMTLNTAPQDQTIPHSDKDSGKCECECLYEGSNQICKHILEITGLKQWEAQAIMARETMKKDGKTPYMQTEAGKGQEESKKKSKDPSRYLFSSMF